MVTQVEEVRFLSGVFFALEQKPTLTTVKNVKKSLEPLPVGSRPFVITKKGTKEDHGFDIQIKQLKGPTMTLRVKPLQLVSDMKHQIANALGVPVEEQRLIVQGKALQETFTILDCHLESGSVINLLRKPTVKSTNPNPYADKEFWTSVYGLIHHHFPTTEQSDKVIEAFKMASEKLGLTKTEMGSSWEG